MLPTVRRLCVLSFVVGLAALLSASTAKAGAPLHLGPFVDTYSFIGMSCDGFEVLIEGTETRTATVFVDEQGEVQRVIERVSAPRDVLTNTVSGKSIVNRAEFTHFFERIPGTDLFTVAITGFRYFVNVAGEGVVLRDVGRIVYATQFQLDVIFSAGVHELAYEADIEPAFCAALA
jgi:hypothetical protein